MAWCENNGVDFLNSASRSSRRATKRGLASPIPGVDPGSHSALPTTRRWQLQLSRVVQVKSRKRRDAWAFGFPSASASASSAAIASTNRVLRARPNRSRDYE